MAISNTKIGWMLSITLTSDTEPLLIAKFDVNAAATAKNSTTTNIKNKLWMPLLNTDKSCLRWSKYIMNAK